MTVTHQTTMGGVGHPINLRVWPCGTPRLQSFRHTTQPSHLCDNFPFLATPKVSLIAMVVTRSQTLSDHKEPGHENVASQDGQGNGVGTRGSLDDEG